MKLIQILADIICGTLLDPKALDRARRRKGAFTRNCGKLPYWTLAKLLLKDSKRTISACLDEFFRELRLKSGAPVHSCSQQAFSKARSGISHSIFKECFEHTLDFLCSADSLSFHARFLGLWGLQVIAIDGSMETERLILRRWEDSDAEDLYKYASDPDVGPIAGWPPHQSIDESREVIRNVFNGKGAYAICLKEDGKAIGAIELKLNGHTDMTERDDECELGYWLGKPFWGQGLMPEAAREILRHAFEDIGMSKVWCGYYEGNAKSKRVQEKVGFKYQWTTEGVDVPLMHEKRTGHVNAMTKEEWIQFRG